MLKAAAVMIAAVPSALIAQTGSQLILCEVQGGETFEVEIGAPSQFGPLNCFYAPGIYDMTPCAPDKGWGLSYPTGNASLADVTTHGMGINHSGGMFWSMLRPTEIVAAAAFGEKPPFGIEIQGDTFWSIVIDRVTGDAVIQTSDGSQEASCEAVDRRF